MKDISEFIAGFRRFQTRYFGKDQTLFDELRLGQKPRVLVIACSDSRVDPAILTDCHPGDLFVVRNVANLIPPYEQGGGYHGVSAALEFAICNVTVEHIIVLGHWGCGGIEALLQGVDGCDTGEFLSKWVNIALPARKQVLSTLPDTSAEEQRRACERSAIQVSLENLKSFPWIRERVERGSLQLHGWYFNIPHGELWGYDEEAGDFKILVEQA